MEERVSLSSFLISELTEYITGLPPQVMLPTAPFECKITIHKLHNEIMLENIGSYKKKMHTPSTVPERTGTALIGAGWTNLTRNIFGCPNSVQTKVYQEHSIYPSEKALTLFFIL